MKNILYIIAIIPFLTFSQIPSGCGSVNWPSHINLNETKLFIAPNFGNGFTYKWFVSSNLRKVSFTDSYNENPSLLIKRISNGQAEISVLIYKDGQIACTDYILLCENECNNYSNYDATTVSCSPAQNVGIGGIRWNITFEVSNPFCDAATYETFVDYPVFEDIGGNFNTISNIGAKQTISGVQRVYEIGNAYGTIPGNYTGHISIKFTNIETGEECINFINVESFCSPSTGGGGGGGSHEKNILDSPISNFIYPNPIKKGEYLNIINLDLKTVINVKVFDLQGNEIKNPTLINDKLYFNSNSRGLHFVKIQTTQGVISEKLIIQ